MTPGAEGLLGQPKEAELGQMTFEDKAGVPGDGSAAPQNIPYPLKWNSDPGPVLAARRAISICKASIEGCGTESL